jgi:hypothetical protein
MEVIKGGWYGNENFMRGTLEFDEKKRTGKG